MVRQGRRSRRALLATVASLLVVLATVAAQAHAAVLQNDSYVAGDIFTCQAGFAVNESAAAGFAAPAADYPIKIDAIRILGCGSQRQITLQMYADSLDGSAAPDTTAFWTSPSGYSLPAALTTIDVSAEDIVVQSGGIRVSATGSPPDDAINLGADDDGIVPQRNFIFAGSWAFAESSAVSGDFVLRAVYHELVPPVTTITDHPKKTVRTSKSRVRASFSFRADEPVSGFECKLDDGDFAACDSPESYRVKRGKHTFKVKATDLADNVGDAASFEFKVVRRR